MTELRSEIPKGKTRIIGVDLFAHEDWLVGDYDKREDAFEIADKKNSARKSSMDSVYYVYDDDGKYLRGDEAVSAATGSIGVKP